jgi:hypothetical protein
MQCQREPVLSIPTYLIHPSSVAQAMQASVDWLRDPNNAACKQTISDEELIIDLISSMS